MRFRIKLILVALIGRAVKLAGVVLPISRSLAVIRRNLEPLDERMSR